MKKPDFKYAWNDLCSCYSVSFRCLKNLEPGWRLELLLLLLVTLLFPILFLLDAFLGVPDDQQ